MRFALALASCTLAGCFIQGPPDDGYYGGGGWGSGWGGEGGAYTLGCEADAECGGGNVCTRTGECLPPSQVRVVRTVWTLRGQPASNATCTRAKDLSITFFSSAGEEFGYTPVPCNAGKFTIDKFPVRFTTVQLARAYDYAGGDTDTFDTTTGTASLDLPY